MAEARVEGMKISPTSCDPSMICTQEDYAWAAGIIYGEGCLFIHRTRAQGSKNSIKTDNYRVSLKVTMGHEPTILRLRSMFGSGSKHRVGQRGWNLAYSWIVSARLLVLVLDAIEPYLFTKKAELRVAREFLALPKWYGGHHRGPKSAEYQRIEYELWDRMRRLKPRTLYRLEMEERGMFNGQKAA